MAIVKQTIDTDTQEVINQRIVSKNKEFFQFSERFATLFRKLNLKNHKAMNLLLFLLEHMNNRNALIISRDTLAEVMEVSKPTIDRWIKFLKDNELINIGRTGSSSIYYVNSAIAWKSGADKRNFAQFTAEVIVSKSEQERNLEKSYEKRIELPRQENNMKLSVALVKHLKNEKGE